jgi:hypothetical protein
MYHHTLFKRRVPVFLVLLVAVEDELRSVVEVEEIWDWTGRITEFELADGGGRGQIGSSPRGGCAGLQHAHLEGEGFGRQRRGDIRIGLAWDAALHYIIGFGKPGMGKGEGGAVGDSGLDYKT